MNNLNNVNKNGIDWVKPIGYMLDYGKILILVEFSDGTFSIIHSPGYEHEEKVPLYIAQAAIEKYGYTSISNQIGMEDMRGIINFANSLLAVS